MALRLTRGERKAQTRVEILDAAQVVFLRHGFHGATLDEIADEAGYTKGAVYSNFVSKNDLFLALLDERFEWRIAETIDAAHRAESFEEAASENARMIAEVWQRSPGWEALLVEFWTHASRDPELRAAAAARHDRVLDAVGQMLDELAARFQLDWTLPSREVARAGGAFARGMALESLLEPGAVSVERFEQEFLSFVKRYLRPQTSKGV
jgi:AcrR family transcriptional regulator